MRLSDHLQDGSHRRGGTCAVERLRNANPQLHTQLLELLAENQQQTPTSPTIAAISNALATAGHPIPAHTLTRHKSGLCRCTKP